MRIVMIVEETLVSSMMSFELSSLSGCPEHQPPSSECLDEHCFFCAMKLLCLAVL